MRSKCFAILVAAGMLVVGPRWAAADTPPEPEPDKSDKKTGDDKTADDKAADDKAAPGPDKTTTVALGFGFLGSVGLKAGASETFSAFVVHITHERRFKHPKVYLGGGLLASLSDNQKSFNPYGVLKAIATKLTPTIPLVVGAGIGFAIIGANPLSSAGFGLTTIGAVGVRFPVMQYTGKAEIGGAALLIGGEVFHAFLMVNVGAVL